MLGQSRGQTLFGNEQTGMFSAVSAKVSYINLQSLGKRQKGGHSDQGKSQNESSWRVHNIQDRHTLSFPCSLVGGVKAITWPVQIHVRCTAPPQLCTSNSYCATSGCRVDTGSLDTWFAPEIKMGKRDKRVVSDTGLCSHCRTCWLMRSWITRTILSMMSLIRRHFHLVRECESL